MPEVVPRAKRTRGSPTVSMGAPAATGAVGAGPADGAAYGVWSGAPARPWAQAAAATVAIRQAPRTAGRVTDRNACSCWGRRSITGGDGRMAAATRHLSAAKGAMTGIMAPSVLALPARLFLPRPRPGRPCRAQGRQRRGAPGLRLPLEDDEHQRVRLRRDRPDDAERLPGAVLPPEDDPRHPLQPALHQRQHPSLFLAASEHTQRVRHAQQLGGRVVAEQPGKGAVRGDGRPIGPEQTEPDRRGVDELAELLLALAERVLDPAPGRHGLAQVGDLLPQAGDLVDEILFGTVLIAHGKD